MVTKPIDIVLGTFISPYMALFYIHRARIQVTCIFYKLLLTSQNENSRKIYYITHQVKIVTTFEHRLWVNM